MVLVIVKALDILELIAREPDRAHSLTEIAEGLGMNQATCVNILKTLVAKNYLEHLGRKKGYRLGPMAYSLTNNANYEQQLVSAARDIMENLTTQLNETSILGVIRNHKRFILHLVDSNQDLQVRSRSERSVYETATGRLLLAFMSDKERETFLAATGLPQAGTWPGAETPDGLLAELALIREHELSVTLSPTHIIGLAVPIRRGAAVIASLSIFLPQVRCPAHRQKELERALREAARQISARISAG